MELSLYLNAILSVTIQINCEQAAGVFIHSFPQLLVVWKILNRDYAMADSYVAPFQGFADGWVSEPRALPWAGISRPFRANSNIADQPFVSRFCHCP